MTRRTSAIRRTVFGLLAGLWLAVFVAGCGPKGPGLENKPPPPGGPKASSRRPPGEIDSPNTR